MVMLKLVETENEKTNPLKNLGILITTQLCNNDDDYDSRTGWAHMELWKCLFQFSDK